MQRSLERTLRLGVLTGRESTHGFRLLNLLRRIGHPVELVVVVDDGIRRKWRLLCRVAASVGWLDACWLAGERLARDRAERRESSWRQEPLIRDYAQLAASVFRTRSLKEAVTIGRIRDARVDLLLLGQSGIVPREILALPASGTLNAHPGLLPAYRGLDCHLWAMQDGDFNAVGSTLHSVDGGIDTGPIVRRRPYRWIGNETLTILQKCLNEDCLDLLLGGVKAIEEGAVATMPQSRGRYCRKMPLRLRRQAQHRLAEFQAGLAPRRS